MAAAPPSKRPRDVAKRSFAADPPPPFTQLPPTQTTSLIGMGSYARVHRSDVYVANRRAEVEYSRKALKECLEDARVILHNVHATGSDATRPLGSMVRALHIGADIDKVNSRLYVDYMMPVYWDMSLRHVCRTDAIGINERMQIAEDLLWGLVRMHEMHISHRDIKPGNILVRKLDDKKTWQVVYADFDSLSIPLWYGAPASVPLRYCATPYYLYALSNPYEREYAARRVSTSIASNYYMSERATESEDVWALASTLWSLFFDGEELMDVSQIKPEANFNIAYVARRMRIVRDVLKKRITDLAEAEFNGNKGDRRCMAILTMFEYVFDTAKINDNGTHLHSVDLYLAFTHAKESMVAPPRMFVDASNPIAVLSSKSSADDFKSVVLSMYEYYGVNDMLLGAYESATAALRGPPHSDVRKLKHVWRFMTFASTISHVTSLVACYFVNNPSVLWPPENGDTSLRHFIMYIATVANMPYTLEFQDETFDEPVLQLHLLSCAALGILPKRGGLSLTDWHGKVKQNQEHPRPNTRWAEVVKHIVNNSKRWFGGTFFMPTTLTIITEAMRIKPGGAATVDGYDAMGVLPLYTPELLRFIRHMLDPANIEDVMRLHQVVHCVVASGDDYAAAIAGRVYELMERTLAGGAASASTQPVLSLARIFSTMSA